MLSNYYFCNTLRVFISNVISGFITLCVFLYSQIIYKNGDFSPFLTYY